MRLYGDLIPKGMEMQIIVDGYNLIRRSAFLAELDRQDLEAGREELLRELAPYQAFKRHRITIVFDGREGGVPIEHREKRGGLVVIFSRQGEVADEVIKRLASPGAVVVTSDRELADAVERAGAVAVDSAAFWAKVEDAAYRRLKGISEEDEEEEKQSLGPRKKGPARKLPKALRRKGEVLRRL